MEKSQIETIKSYLDFSKTAQFVQILQDDFNKLKEITNQIRTLNLKPTNEGEKDYNRRKNRYRDILPYDETRVKLDFIRTDEDMYETGSDYINANLISNVMDNYYKYIAAQGPCKETVVDFIRMLVQYNVKIVICACNEYEGQKLKCHRYWPENSEESYTFYKNYSISHRTEPIILDDCIIRNLKVKYMPNLNNNEQTYQEYEFTQFHLVNWPDHGVPNNVDSILEILSIVRKKMIENNRLTNESLNKLNHKISSKKFNIPLSDDYLVVHCSAGCGRTGTIIAIDQLWTLINENKLNSNFSLYEIAKSLREQRIAMIQTQSQYIFFAKATLILFDRYLKCLSEQNSAQSDYNNQPVKQSFSNTTNQNSVNSNTVPITKLNTEPYITLSIGKINRKNGLDSNNNNLDYSDENNSRPSSNDDKSLLNNLTPPKSPLNKSKQNPISKYVDTPLTTVKQKINRFVPNMFQIFTQTNTPPTSSSHPSPNSTSTNTNNTNTSIINTPSSASSSSSSPSPISLSSSSSTSSSAPASHSSTSSSTITSGTAKTSKNLTQVSSSKTQIEPTCQIDDDLDVIVTSNQINRVPKNQSRITTPTSTIQAPETSAKTTGHLFRRNDSNRVEYELNRARSVTRLASATSTPIKTSPKHPRKLSANSDRSEYDLYSNSSNQRQNNISPDISELYLNDKSLYKKEPGSGTEFLLNKLNLQMQYKFDLQNNNIPKSFLVNNHGQLDDYTKSTTDTNLNIRNRAPSPYTDLTSISRSTTNLQSNNNNIKLVQNNAKLSSSKQTDLRQMNPPMKAELLDSLPPKQIPNEANRRSPESETPKPPLRIKNKKLLINQDDRYKYVDININNQCSSTSSSSNEIRPSRSIKLNYEKQASQNFSIYKTHNSDLVYPVRGNLSSSSNRLNQNYRNGILIDINQNSENSKFKESTSSTQHQQTYYKLKAQKYDILTLPNKKYVQSTNHIDSDLIDEDQSNPFPYYGNSVTVSSNNSSMPINRTINKHRHSSIGNINSHNNSELANISYHHIPNKLHYYHFVNNVRNLNNRKSVKIENYNEYYDNNIMVNGTNRSDIILENNLKRRSTQVFDL